MPSEIHTDPFLPVLRAGTPPSLTTDEQRDYIKRILDKACSDSRFADKAYVSILLVLAAGAEPVEPPVPVTPTVTGLTPSSAIIGSPDFTLHVMGTGFNAVDSVILINGVAAPTTYVSATELTTPVDMGLVLAPVVAPVTVANGVLVSNAMSFTVTAV